MEIQNKYSSSSDALIIEVVSNQTIELWITNLERLLKDKNWKYSEPCKNNETRFHCTKSD